MNTAVYISGLKSRFGEILRRATSLAIGAVLVLSGYSHLQNDLNFFANVLDYQIVGPEFAAIVSFVVPWLEIVTGGALIMRLASQPALYWAVLLFVVFLLSQCYVIWLGRVVDCGCFGNLHRETIGPETALRTLALLAVSAALAIDAFRQRPSPAASDHAFDA